MNPHSIKILDCIRFHPLKVKQAEPKSGSGKSCDFCNAEQEKRCPKSGCIIKLKPIYTSRNKKQKIAPCPTSIE